MNCSISSFAVVLGVFFSLMAVDLAYAGCPKDAAVERMVESVDIDSDEAKPERIETGETEGLKEEPVSVAGKKPDTIQKNSSKPAELGIEQLVVRLKKTKAIGLFTKLAIRSDVFDFKEAVESYRKREEFEENSEQLRDRFNGLLLKILALLDSDPVLSKDIHLARDTIWKSLVEVKS
ncbi:MAG: hypothetical protein ABUK11_09750 [Mariprofundaceae bacterium]